MSVALAGWRRGRARAWAVPGLLGAIVVAVAMTIPALAWATTQAASWRYDPAAPPPPPAGVSPGPYGVPLGVVGEISFWAPDRGLLITGGTEEAGGGPVPPGLYAYDGRSWHQLSTVCGGSEGRVVWAGPDEFWTIANQRSGQITSTSSLGEQEAPGLSLCHFEGAEVVGSYAMPLQEADSWVHMDSGACYSPTDCWFGGADGAPPNQGAFHLHWDGSSVTAVYEPEDHAVTSIASFKGSLYEAVQIEASDVRLEGESLTPSVIHTIAPSGVEPAFGNLTIVSQETKKLLPEYGQEVLPEALFGFDLATDAPAGAAATQLWAAASPVAEPPSGKRTTLTVLHDGAGGWSQIAPSQGGSTPLAGQSLAGSHTALGKTSEWGTSGAIAPEPGSEGAWLSLQGGGAGARVALLEAAKCEPTPGKREACGKISREDVLPEAGEKVGYLGRSGPIDCPAAHDCWMATTEERAAKSGWLFHLTEETAAQEAVKETDGDPLFEGADGVITYRPPDSGVPVFYSDGFVNDDSLENQEIIKEPSPPPPPPQEKPVKVKAKQLVKHVKSKLVDHRTLVIEFTLTAKAHVQLTARRYHAVVAKTRRESLHPGHHTLSLTLNPSRWPTKLQFEAKPVGAGHNSASSEESSGSGNVIGT